MCVTNTTSRRPQPVSFNPHQVSLSQSLLSQRLLSAFIPNVVQKQTVPVYDQSKFQPLSEFVSTENIDKPRPKRRRKPQKPGKTAKNNDRHFVVHDYHDHSLDDDVEIGESDDANHCRRGGVSVAFPLKLHTVLDQVEADGLAHVVSWQSHGRAFVIHKPKEFVDHVMPKYFRQSKLTSFQRQLNLYGFCRLTRGKDAGGYYHELFLRGKVCLCKKMTRTKVKGTKFKAASSPEHEPDFYQMPPITVTPYTSEDDNSHDYCSMNQVEAACVQNASCVTVSLSDTYTVPYAQLPIAEPQINRNCITSQYGASIPSHSYSNRLPVPYDADRILDEAVDELFMQHEELDNLDEFVHDWDPGFDQSGISYTAIEDDCQLGFLLEKLLED